MSLSNEVESLLRLRLLPGLSDARLRELLAARGSAAAALRAAAPRSTDAAFELRVRRARESIERLGVVVMAERDARYPEALRHLHDPPPVLFARGRLELLERAAVAVVGSRRATAYGLDAARVLAGGLSRAGLVVVSGLARGIDTTAHEAALDTGTVAVLGSGIDVAYPRENEELQERIAAGGLVLSEFPPGSPPLRHHFVQRNRVIAALARGVLVVEAPLKSGALITAAYALDLGRDVFAVPGPIGRPGSEGTNLLIQDGAKLVVCAADVLEEVGLPVPPDEPTDGAAAEPSADLTPSALAVWRQLGSDPAHADELAAGGGLAAGQALGALLELELAGLARQFPGLRFARAGRP